MEPIGQVQVLGNEHDLRKGQRVDQRESVECVINVMLGEDNGPMNNERGENNKEVKRDYQVLLSSQGRLSALTKCWWASLTVASPQVFRSSSNSSARDRARRKQVRLSSSRYANEISRTMM